MSADQRQPRIFVVGMGLVTPAGIGCEATLSAMEQGARHLAPLSVFPVPGTPLPVGQVSELAEQNELPRTHRLALIAAKEAMFNAVTPPDAIVLGGTTGGMPQTEELLRAGVAVPERYEKHATGSVADELAATYNCAGPAITVSTACSSGAVAMTIALEMLRGGEFCTVLAGGVDGLCRLTYHGFKMLQLLDAEGTRPLDIGRAGMSVGEGAGVFLLQAATTPPQGTLAELLGGGLSCDAYHSSAPQPDGKGALAAMCAALEDSHIEAHQVDYVNLHGTGTKDNDSSEARAVNALFPDGPPPVSSTKGTFGHSLAAAGSVEAGISILAMNHGLLPANVGCVVSDPTLKLSPLLKPLAHRPRVVLSNSLGFGGNNASLVFGNPSYGSSLQPVAYKPRSPTLRVLGTACITGAGHLSETLVALDQGRDFAGILETSLVTRELEPRSLRRLKRLQRLTLALGFAAGGQAGEAVQPFGVYLGTAWGPLSETNDFLQRLFRSSDEFSSPTDFVGSVHNAVAGQLAIRCGAEGPNVTATAGDVSFEQAVLCATLLADHRPFILGGVDEAHSTLSTLFDPSVAAADVLADGGAAFLSRRAVHGEPGPFISLLHLARPESNANSLVAALGGARRIQDRYAAIFVGVPLAHRQGGDSRLQKFIQTTSFAGPVFHYRQAIGEIATSSAIATALAVALVQRGFLPEAMVSSGNAELNSKGVLLLNLGPNSAALEVMP